MARHPSVTEIFYGGQWNEMPVREQNPITITRGRGDEAGQIVPSKSNFTIDSRTTNYSPLDPLSPIYGYAGRGAPVRHAIRHGETTGYLADAADAFERSEATGWGTADVGGAWSLFGSGGSVTDSDIRVAAGVGEMDVGGAAWYRATYLPQLYVADVTQVVTVTAPVATGADLEVGLMARGTDINNYVMGRVHLATTGAVTLNIYSADDTLLGSTSVPGVTHTGAALRLKMRTVARDVFLRVWTASDPEPTAWHLHAVDTTAVPVVGWVGIRTGRASGNTNTVEPQAVYDDYETTVEDPRFYGEVSAWKPRSSIGFDRAAGLGDCWTEIEAFDILHRLTGDPMDSAARRAVLAAGPLAYWPLEDKEGSTSAQSLVPGVLPLSARLSGYLDPVTGKRFPPPGLPKFAAAEGLGGGGSAVSMAEGGTLQTIIPLSSTAVSWEIHFAVKFTPEIFAGASSIASTMQWLTTGDPQHWAIAFAEDQVLVTADASPFVFDGVAGLDDGAWHHVAVFAAQNGSDIDAEILIDDVQIGTGVFPGTTIGQPISIELNNGETVDEKLPIGLGHLAIYSPYLSSAAASAMVSAYHGHIGETAGNRIERLCAEEGVAFAGVGDLGSTMPMGPQAAKPFLDQLAECERTDVGVMLAPAGWLGLTYKARTALYNQDAVLTLDATGQQLSTPLEPNVDDLGIGNDVTVTSPSGSVGTATEVVGPMSIQAPPDGIGRKKASIDANPASDPDLAQIAGWYLRAGTIEDARYPSLTLDLDSAPSLRGSAAAANPGTVLDIDNLLVDTVRVLIGQQVETLGDYRRKIAFAGSPADAQQVGVVEDDQYGYVGSNDTATTAEFVSGTDTLMTVAIGDQLWGHGAGMDLKASGVRLRLEAVGEIISLNPFLRTDASDWVAQSGSIAYTTSQQYRTEWGTIEVTPDGVAASGGVLGTQVVVSASTSYVVQGWFYSAAGYSDLRAAVDWYTGAGAYISSSLGSGIAVPADEWTYQTQTFTSPGTAGKAVIRGRIGGSPAASDVWYATALALIPASTRNVSPQTFTIQQAPVNGVVKTIPVGTSVDLWTPWRAAL